MFENPISRTYDGIDEAGDDLLFHSPTSEDLRDLHPSTVHIFRLWQRFLESVNPLVKIFHAPTVQQQVLDATSDLDDVPKGVEALMFGIYCMSIVSFPEFECIPIFGETKATLLKRYHSGVRLALQRAGLLRSSDLTILQAYVLYLVSNAQSFRPYPFAYSGTDVMSQFHDGSTFALLPHGYRCSDCPEDGVDLRWHDLWPSSISGRDAAPVVVANPPARQSCGRIIGCWISYPKSDLDNKTTLKRQR